MRRLAGTFIAIALIAAIAVSTASTAAADVGCRKLNLRSGQCVVKIKVPPAGRSDPAGKGSPQTNGRNQAESCSLAGQRVSCRTAAGIWSTTHRCYVKAMAKQLPKSDPTWEGHKTGRLYWCTIPPDQDSYPVWLATAPGAAPPPDPLVLAQQAIRTMDLKAVRIGIVPEPRPGRIGVIGLPTWMWADRRGRAHVGADLPYGVGCAGSA